MRTAFAADIHIRHHHPAPLVADFQISAHRCNIPRRKQRGTASEAEIREGAALQTNILAPELGLLPAADADGSADALDLAAVLRRVKEIVRVLENFKSLRDPERSRSEYMDQVGLYPTEPVANTLDGRTWVMPPA